MAGVAAVVAAGVLLLAGWSPAAAAGQMPQAGSARTFVYADVSTGTLQPADPLAKARPNPRQASSGQPDGVALLVAAAVAAAVGAAVIGGKRQDSE